MVLAGRQDMQLRDRTVLGVLLVRDGVVPVGAIVDALWGDRAPESARKVVQGSVMRLRRLLGSSSIATVGDGYRLDIADAEVDVWLLEGLVAEARAALADGYGERAARILAEALALWRGDPLPELDGWPPARAEATRLVALRESAEELTVEALLAAGHADEAAAAAASLADAAPYREPLWVAWARALYAAGRQADALNVLGRLRAALSDDLGIDPAPQTAELEVAILRQDPDLEVPLAATAGAECPWPGLLSYEAGQILFARGPEVESAARRLADSRVLVVVGGSGVGKSSFARAGLASALGATVVTPGSQPATCLDGVTTPDLVVDQAEELVTQCDDPRERAELVGRLVSWPGRVVVVVRTDLLDEFASYNGFAGLLQRGLFVLRPLDEQGLRTVIEGPAKEAGLRLEPGLTELLLAECHDQPGALPLLSHVLGEIWQRAEGNLLSVRGYRSCGGIRGALASSAERIHDDLDDDGRRAMRSLFRRLVALDDRDPVRLRVPRSDVVGAHADLVERLLRARLLSSASDGSLQLAHEALARHWPRLVDWLAEDASGQRLLRHLGAEAHEWERAGRPADGLYRGMRLEAAVGWAAAHEDELTPLESAFLARSREEAEGELIRVRHTNRRLRVALGAAVGLLVVASVGIGMAVHQTGQAEAARDAARAARDVSEGLRLGELAQAQDNPSVAFGLAAEALAVDDSEATRTRVLDTFANFEALLSTGSPPPVPWPDDARRLRSPDGRFVAVADNTAVELRAAGTQRRLFRLVTLTEQPTALAFSPDGSMLAAGMSQPGFAATGTTMVWDTATGVEVGRYDSGDGSVTAHVFAADGSSVWADGDDGVHRWDLTRSRVVVRTQEGRPTIYRNGTDVLSLWDESVDPWVDRACTLAGRSLTPTEWRRDVGDRPYAPSCG